MASNRPISESMFNGLLPRLQSQVEAVFNKARVIDSAHEMLGIRLDVDGNRIYRPAYGDRNAAMGWEIDHIVPQSRGGSDEISNLQPLHWQANAKKQDTMPWTNPFARLGS